ncbi:hypothetical protein CLAFUW4_01245 [Fulvia fulva]|uniref:EKC/KEOPS complex subunit GON7 n=1 Tax=Passalora fulva TaxID=5499 RepID=A0A9Q8L7B6_PASFU|nr:uncharacterized protein CLAFUR5_01250 [Fulvia fulva]KAK4634422.1 hypothetical protein CLAFUR4_01246 [Fulvia fulva]KAK4638468.1 hypothetical protein CLAFUR0_01247 [Fulvia fulva]UJO11528.1 hypothetical protein CLAFUR5_01250 [Fulvia fulva]WPV09214.1 hypothetical protein CLAFUW4_01245 [Fulvia fulva]WPV24519.1 hypothetical protein CLAFUW7_01250 [Fulvia fulva]
MQQATTSGAQAKLRLHLLPADFNVVASRSPPHLDHNAQSQQTMSPSSLVAHYKSPHATQSFSSELPHLPEDGANVEQQKTAYLAALRANTTKLQDEVNVYLTQKMDEDKVAESARGKSSKDMEEREENMYGEEDPEETG